MPVAQQLKQLRREHDIAILVTLALLDAQRHPLAVNVELGRAAEESREVFDVTDVILLDLLREMTRRHVFDHALAQRADGLVRHRDSQTREPPLARRLMALATFRRLERISAFHPRTKPLAR